ncbi:MAG: hypothetical protein F6K19_05365 [Cyanothece sp. SIO1E1]|nr:hypothetical protein [Cyanothece sp. SIO1E1]
MLLLLVGVGCTTQPKVPARSIQLHQSWALQPGSRIANYQITGGLGDISIALKGHRVHAPFTGRVQPLSSDCVIFSSPEIPAYLFRLCGIKRPRLGALKAGEVFGSSHALQFAALRKQPNGTWAIVEPAADVLERTIGHP